MSMISGVDGCRGGWFAATKDIDSGKISWGIFQKLETLVSSQTEIQVIAIDIPIGLTENGARTCDLEARHILGKGRSSSVYSAPIRPMLAANSYREACDVGFQTEGRMLSRQTWGIVPKIKEVDSLLQADHALAGRVYEVHPEVSFFFLAGKCHLIHGKKKSLGREERQRLLQPLFGDWLQAALSERTKSICAEDDILDAFVVLWTAERIMRKEAQFLPQENIQDRLGLRMAIAT